MVWLAWLAVIGIPLAMLVLGVWHPHFLPVTAALGAFLAAALALLVVGAWQSVAGPRRAHALASLLWGLAPFGLVAGHLMYGFGTAYGRQFDLNWPLRVLVPFGESILDLVARFQYPVRTEGERVVMISTPVENAREQVDAMDRHIKALEARLGRQGTRRIHWVRGPILGIQGKALLGMCMGSRATVHWEQPDSEGLTTLDRHEVAHVVLTQFCTVAMEPPAILMEGWAEMAAAADPRSYRLRAGTERENGRMLALADLVGPAWYGRHDLPVYTQGAPLVDFILRQFGPNRFVNLYANCRRETFAADVQRVLGVSIGQLDEGYQADLEKQIGPGGYHEYWLRSLALGPKVNAAEWNQFVSDYLAGAKRLLAPYEHVRLSWEQLDEAEDEPKKLNTSAHRYEIKRAGPLKSFRGVQKDFEEVFLARPDQSFHAERRLPEGAWEIRGDLSVKPDHAYRRAFRRIDDLDMVYWATVPLLQLADSSMNMASPFNLRVTGLERTAENGHPLVILELEGWPGHPWLRTDTVWISADDFTTPRNETVSEKGNLWRSNAVYDSRDGLPLLKSSRGEGQGGHGTPGKTAVTVVDRRFENVPDDEFTQAALLGDAPVQHESQRPEPVEVSPLLTWYPAPLLMSALFLVAGAAMELLARKRARGL
jgi:hypothetical protein